MTHRDKGAKRKKFITKKRLKKGINGSISILLCLILTPFLSIALGLVEYARYQEVFEVVDEVYELTGISMLSDYDPYIHKRFGLLATSQKNAIGTGMDSVLKENAKILGNQVTIDNSSFTGEFSLNNAEVLRRQVVDFSELTSTTAVLLEDFQLEELINRLQNVSQFQDLMNTMDSLADMADALSNAVDALENLKTSVSNLQGSISSTKATAESVAEKMKDLYKKLGDNGIMLPESATLSEIENAINAFCNEYVEDFKSICIDAKSLVDSLKGIKTNLDNVKSSAGAFVAAVEAAKQAASNIKTSNNADQSGTVSGAAQRTMDDVLNSMTELVEGALADIKDETINVAKNTVNEIINTAIEEVGLGEFIDRYSDIVSGNYFSLPLSSIAKQDLTDLLKKVKEIYSAQDSSDIADGLLSFFKGKLVPNIHVDTGNLMEKIGQVMNSATNSLTNSVTDKVTSLLTDLVNIVKNLFDLDLFYEPDLNAYVDIGGASSNPYQQFLNAVGNLFSAIDDFKSAMEEGGIFKKLFGALKAVGKMFKSIGDLLKAIFNIAGETINSIAELGGSVITGDVQRLYEKLLISGYMRHNLPCRLNSGTWQAAGGGSATYKVSLTGSGLTGFAYDGIARPENYLGQIATETGFQKMAQIIQNLKAGHGSDKMFKGAELEYIRGGTNSEIVNQIIVFMDIYFLRLLLDIPSIFMDGEVETVAAAATIASWVVYILYILVEPFCDTLLLVNGQEVPLIRTDCWMTATGIGSFISKMGEAVLGPELRKELNDYAGEYLEGHSSSGGTGTMELNYQSHVLILLFIFVDSNTQISRLQSLIELEAKEYYRQRGETFQMEKTYTTVEMAADVTFSSFFDLGGGLTLPSKRIKQTVCY